MMEIGDHEMRATAILGTGQTAFKEKMMSSASHVPNEVGIAVERDTFHQVGALYLEPLQSGPKRRRDDKGVAIDQTSSSRQECKVIGEMGLALSCQILRDGAGEEQDDDDGGGDPEGAVQVGVAVKHVEEV